MAFTTTFPTRDFATSVCQIVATGSAVGSS